MHAFLERGSHECTVQDLDLLICSSVLGVCYSFIRLSTAPFVCSNELACLERIGNSTHLLLKGGNAELVVPTE